MNKKIGMGIAIGIVAGSIAVGALNNSSSSSDLIRNKLMNQKLNLLGSTVEQQYIGDSRYLGEWDKEKIPEGIYKGFVSGLEDENTEYLTAEEFKKQKVESSGDYIGTGILYGWGVGAQHLIVLEAVPGSPAEKAGIKTGDKITEIDGIKTMMSNEVSLYEKIYYTGPEEVTYGIESNDGSNKRLVKLKADTVKMPLIKAQLLEDHVGYIRLKSLRKGSTLAIKDTLEELKRQGATKFILDLRSTDGDHLEEAKQMGELFIDHKALLSIKDKNGVVETYSTKEATFKEEPIVLITNHYTEGTIEGFIAAFKTYKRGSIIGEKTSGNGTIQELIPLKDGSGLRITTGLLLGADNTPIKGNGIKPDVIKAAASEDTIELFTTGSLSLEKDSLVQEALNILKRE